MASNIDERQLLTWFTDCLVASSLAQASGTTTTAVQMVTSLNAYIAGDPNLTNQEKALASAISTAFSKAATQPSSAIHAVL